MNFRACIIPSVALFATLVSLPQSRARAQSSGSATVAMTAQVVQPLTVSASRPLDFGSVFVGNNKTIAPSAATAGQVDIKGQSNANISVTLTMPTMLMLGNTGTGLTLNNWNYSTSLAPTPVSFPGQSSTPIAMTLPTSASYGRITLNIGATASAAAGQTPGDYTGSGQITVTYTDL